MGTTIAILNIRFPQAPISFLCFCDSKTNNDSHLGQMYTSRPIDIFVSCYKARNKFPEDTPAFRSAFLETVQMNQVFISDHINLKIIQRIINSWSKAFSDLRLEILGSQLNAFKRCL